MFQLRELERRDIPIINGWRNNPDLISYLGAAFRYINSEVDEKWFDNYMNNRHSTIRCSIIDEHQNLVGLITLASINMLNQSAELHIMIGDSLNQGKGAGTFAVSEMLKHGFMNLNLNRISLNVLESNKRAIHLYEKCGFSMEGTLRQAVYKNGKYEDMFVYSILKEEFLKNGDENLCQIKF